MVPGPATTALAITTTAPTTIIRATTMATTTAPATTATATTADPDRPDGAHTITIIAGMARDGGTSIRSCGSTRIIRNGPRWTRAGSTRTATTTTTTTGTTPTGGIRTIRIFSTPII